MPGAKAKTTTFKIETELLGEVRVDEDGTEEFSTGISQYPYLGAVAHRIRSADLMRIYDAGTGDTAVIGKLTQDESIDASIHIPSMLSKHFAIVGSTGVGKSTAVSLLLHKAIEADPKLRVLILDPHNEFAAAFPAPFGRRRYRHARPALLADAAGGVCRSRLPRPPAGAGRARHAARHHAGGQARLPRQRQFAGHAAPPKRARSPPTRRSPTAWPICWR
jgi:hypothetical protein